MLDTNEVRIKNLVVNLIFSCTGAPKPKQLGLLYFYSVLNRIKECHVNFMFDLFFQFNRFCPNPLHPINDDKKTLT